MSVRDRRAVRGGASGQSMVEFAIAAPVALLIIFGIIAFSLLAYQNVALRDGASAGARMATVETSLAQAQGSQYCESGSPVSIEKAVAQAMPQVQFDTAPLCTSSMTPTPLPTSLTTLSQASQAGRATIVVTASPNISNPTTVKVTVTVTVNGIAPGFQGSHTMSASSTVPIEQP